MGMSKKYWPRLRQAGLPGLALFVDHDDEADHRAIYRYL
jgi:hypothetical protein